ncbi:MAG: Gfo/Idh/MocA family oxidoreductase [Eubacteriales bacterium]|nr:Gfo/Idh/MocA family oxidoreductase [Eubacteriales bacterium]
MIRFATIGTNFITKNFLEAAEKCSELCLSGVYSRGEDTAISFAEQYRVNKWYTDLNKLAEDKEIDAVYIASPNSLHCAQAVLMMNHGKHVLCEKPIASNGEELEHMLETAKKNGVVLLEAMRPVFDPGFKAVCDNLPKLGKVRRVTFQFCQYSSRYDKYKKGIVENAFRPEFSNGALMDIGVYCVHPLVKLFGMPESVRAEAVFLDNGVDGAGTILAGYPDMQAELIYSKIADGSLPSQIQGEEGNMLIRQIQDTVDIRIQYRKGEEEIIPVEKESNNMYYEAVEWARLINQGLSTEEYDCCSLMELSVMDEARKQLGIVFPADKEKRWEIEVGK